MNVRTVEVTLSEHDTKHIETIRECMRPRVLRNCMPNYTGVWYRGPELALAVCSDGDVREVSLRRNDEQPVVH